jgi:hypothetical protein
MTPASGSSSSGNGSGRRVPSNTGGGFGGRGGHSSVSTRGWITSMLQGALRHESEKAPVGAQTPPRDEPHHRSDWHRGRSASERPGNPTEGKGDGERRSYRLDPGICLCTVTHRGMRVPDSQLGARFA